MQSRGKDLYSAIGHWQIRQVSRSDWDGYFRICSNPNMLQSWEYGQAKEDAGRWKALRLVVFNEDSKPIALVQVLTWCLPILGGVARINRGPLLLVEESRDELQLNIDVLNVLMREARRRRWWVIQIAPEISDSESARQAMLDLRLRKQDNIPWASGLIDLGLSEQELYGRLNRRWQRTLKKAANLGVIVKEVKLTEERLADVLKSYADLQKRNEFGGINSGFIEKMASRQSGDFYIYLYVAEFSSNSGLNEHLGYRLIVKNGCTAFDFLVSTNERGRELEANSALYWHAIIHAKQCGCAWFDIGGLNEATPKGIAEFKQGLNALPYKLVGEWRKFNYILI